MLLLLILAGYTLAVVCLGPRLATARGWASASPRLGLLLCQAVAAAALSGVALIAAMTAVSVQHLRADVGHLLHACAEAVWDGATHPGVEATTALGLLGVAGLAHLSRTAVTSARSARRVRREQREGLALLGERASGLGYTAIPSDVPFAYCLPGEGGRIVVSTAAERELDSDQLDAVLAHERAHLRGRHHVLVQIVHVLAKALPLPPMRELHADVCALVEMAADDSACRVSDRDALLTALVRLGSARRPVPGLAANGSATVVRALRLAEPGPSQSLLRQAAVCAGAAVLVLTPWVLGGVPVALALTGHCDG